jgi:hypothetical protein
MCHELVRANTVRQGSVSTQGMQLRPSYTARRADLRVGRVLLYRIWRSSPSPLHDDLPRRRFPAMMLAVIAVNVAAAFVFELHHGLLLSTLDYGLIPWLTSAASSRAFFIVPLFVDAPTAIHPQRQIADWVHPPGP